MKEKKVWIPSSEIRLEGLLSIQEASSFNGGVILCHPHPQYGGDMDNPVITAAVEAASQVGFSTLRFNFRGVGGSGGSYGEGKGEREDVKAVIDYFYCQLEDLRPSMILLGYSFGAWTGLPVAMRDERIGAMVVIAPPLEIYDFDFLKGCQKRKLFIAGNRDLFCPLSLLEGWYQGLDEPKSLRIIPGADHFFLFHSQMLIPPLREFFQTLKNSKQ